MDMFTFHPERFAAGRQDVRLRCLADDAFGQRCRNADNMLAIVEHEQDLPVANKGQQTNDRVLGLHHEPEYRRDRCRHELGIGQSSQIDEEHRALESANQRMSDRDRYGGFSDPAGTDDTDEAPLLKLLRQRSNGVITADHSRWSRRQFFDSFRCADLSHPSRLLGARACNWRNKAITPTGNIGYVASTVSSVAKCLPKGRHLKAEVGFLHRHIRPRRRDKFLASDDFPGPLHECDQDVERAATERYRLVDLLEQPLGHKQPEWAERYCVS